MNRRDFLGLAAVAPLALAASPAAVARRLGGIPLALVTADAESRLVAFDLSSSRIVSYVETPARPKSVESVLTRTAVVAHPDEGVVTLVDGVSLRVLRVLPDFEEPRYTAGSPDGSLAYVTDAGRGDLVTVDLRSARIVHRTPVGAHARHITIAPSGRTLWTALGFRAPAISVVDLSHPGRPRLARRIVPPFHAHDVVFAPDGLRVWVSSSDERRLVVFDALTLRPLFTLPAGAPPQHIAFTARAAYVTSDDAVRVHRVSDGHLLRTTPVPEGSYNVTQGWGRVFTPSLEHGTLAVLDERGSPVTRTRVARSAHDACFVVAARSP